MSLSELGNLLYSWEGKLDKDFKDKFYDALNDVEKEILDFEDEICDLQTEVSDLKRKVCRLEDDIEDLESGIQDIKDSSKVYYNSLEDELKEEWWEAVRNKYTLAQLEAILGNRFNLKDI